MVQRVLLPTVSAVTVGAMTVGVAFAVTGTSSPASSPVNFEQPANPASGTGLPPTDRVDQTSALTPSPDVATAITDAVYTSPLTASVPATHYEVANSRLAASDQSWAWTELQPRADDVDRVEAVLHEVDGRWEVVQLGSFEVGCDVAPRQVLEDLELYCGGWDAPVDNVPAGDVPTYDA